MGKVAKKYWENTGKTVASNGAVMRTAIMGVPYFYNLGKVVENTKNVCRVSLYDHKIFILFQTTHYDDRCVASCVAITTVISLLLRSTEKVTDFEYIKWQAFKIAETFTEHKQSLKDHLFVKSFAELNLEEEKTRGFTFKTTGAAFCALSMLSSKTFEQIIEELVREAGDADT